MFKDQPSVAQGITDPEGKIAEAAKPIDMHISTLPMTTSPEVAENLQQCIASFAREIVEAAKSGKITIEEKADTEPNS